MNKKINFMIFSLGVAVGSGVTWRYVEKKYEKITQDDYNMASVEFPVIDWSAYPRYDDHRDTSSQELACSGGTCVLNL